MASTWFGLPMREPIVTRSSCELLGEGSRAGEVEEALALAERVGALRHEVGGQLEGRGARVVGDAGGEPELHRLLP